MLVCGGVASLGGRRGVVEGASNGVSSCSLSVVTVVVLVDEESAFLIPFGEEDKSTVNASESSGWFSVGRSSGGGGGGAESAATEEIGAGSVSGTVSGIVGIGGEGTTGAGAV